jgi:hypothetical protein
MRAAILVSLTALFLGSAQAALLPADVPYVIITRDDLAAAFEPLASFKTGVDLPTRVVTLDWIATQVTPGFDEPATIRAFLQEAWGAWGTRYVLLGGTTDIVPTRWITNTYYPTNGSTLIPADIYYAALDGDWDGDGDGVLGEPWLSAENPGDGADLAPELALGRAPVATAAEAVLFVMKNLDFQVQSGPEVPARALLEAEVIFPYGYGTDQDYIILDGAVHAEVLRSTLESASPAWQTERYYEYRVGRPGALASTAAAVIGAMNTGGFRLVNLYGPLFGQNFSFGPDLVPYSVLSDLTNERPFFLGFSGLGGEGVELPIRVALNAPAGGCAGGIGFSRAAFPSTCTRYIEAFYRHATASRTATVGQAHAATLNDLIANTYTNYVDRWTHLTFTLLADPTASLQPIDMTVAIEDDTPVDDADPATELPSALVSLMASPNPFNPQVDIRAEIPVAGQARLYVCDLRGSLVRDLHAGSLPAGESRWRWNGQDNAGRAVASGVYLLRLETDRRIVQRSLTLAR